ncbi:MAG: hypothetical protein SGARI_006628 [Bacillariaceae sp.]
MIADRRKDQQKTAKKATAKKASTTDRSIATGRAKRDAAMKARRGMTQDKKPSAMEVEREVYRQSRKTATAKGRAEQKASGGRLPPNSSLRDKKGKKGAAAGKKQAPAAAAVAVTGGRPPSKKQVQAAVKAVQACGQPIPDGHQLVLTFVPTFQQPKAPPKNQAKSKKGAAGGNQKQQTKNQPKKNNNNKGRGYQKKILRLD